MKESRRGKEKGQWRRKEATARGKFGGKGKAIQTGTRGTLSHSRGPKIYNETDKRLNYIDRNKLKQQTSKVQHYNNERNNAHK